MTLPIPEKVLDQHCILLGKTRAGKSSTLRVLVEHLLDHEKPVCIIDPKGDWWGLKSSADGKSAGYAVIIFGGPHADVPINAHSGAHVAELVSTGNRPCIIDLKGWMPGERTKFFVDFASTMFRLTQGIRWLVIDEVHNFAPQGKVLDPEAGKMLHWANRLISEGSGMGVTLLSASQRPQKVHKDFVTSNETLFALRVIHKLDRDADKEWIDGCADPQAGKDVLASLASLKRGEAWVWSPEIEFGPKRVQFPLFRTYDSFKPQPGAPTKLKGWAEVDLDEVRSKLATVMDEAKANDPRALKAEISRLRGELNRQTASVSLKPTPANAPKFDPNTPAALRDRERAWNAGQKEGHNNGFAVGYKKGHRAGYLEAEALAEKTFKLATNQLRGLGERLSDDMRGAFQIVPYVEPTLSKATVPVSLTAYGKETMEVVDRVSVDKTPSVPKVVRHTDHLPSIASKLPQPQQRILNAIFTWERLGTMTPSNAQTAWLAGYSPTSSSYTNPRGALKGAGMVVYPNPDRLALTNEGRMAAESGDMPASILDFVLGQLPEPQKRILRVLAVGGQPISNEELAQAAGYSHTSSSYTNPRGSLKTKELVTYPSPGFVQASDWLFAKVQ